LRYRYYWQWNFTNCGERSATTFNLPVAFSNLAFTLVQLRIAEISMDRIHQHGNQRMLVCMDECIRAQPLGDIAGCGVRDTFTPLRISACRSIFSRQFIEFHLFPRFRFASRVGVV